MASFNQVTLLGNLTRDPQLRYTPQGVAVCEVSLAVNRKYVRKTGDKVDEVAFVDITCWSRLAEISAEFLKKGRGVLVAGHLTQDRWEEEGTGKKRSKLRVVAETLEFLGSGSKDDPVPEGDATVEEETTPEASAPGRPKAPDAAKARR